MTDNRLDRKALPAKVREFAARAWRRPLDKETPAYIDKIFAEEFAAGNREEEALRNALTIVLSDPKFMYLSRVGLDARARNHELEVLPNGKILLCLRRPNRFVEFNMQTGKMVW